MSSFRRVATTALVLLFAFSNFAPLPVVHAQDTVFTRTFTQKFSTVAIENLGGKTSIQTWNSSRLRILASRNTPDGSVQSIESRLQFQITQSESLRVVVRESANPNPINLTIYLPRQINLSLKGGDDAITVNGVTNSLFAQTESGSISLSLPENAHTDLSLRSIEGTITSNLQMSIFGPVNAHSLDGRIGKGGVPVILRSARGPLSLKSDDPGRLAKADAQIDVDRNTFGNSLVKVSQAASGAGTQPDGSPATDNNGPAETTSIATPNSVQVDNAGLDVVKIDSRLVNLNVRVTDGTGKLIPDLSKDDFEVFEDGVKQEVVRFEPVNTPVNVVMLLDLSGSTKDRWKIIKKAAKKFIDTLSPNTPIAVAAFTRKFLLISEFTFDRKLLKDRIDDTKNLRSGTAFYDATWSTLDLFKEVKEQRKAIVVMTDGVDNSISSDEYEPRHPFDELLERIMQEEVTIYPIYFNTEFEVTVKMGGSDTHESYVTARKQLQTIADETGGTLFKADRAEDLEGVYQRVASELQTLYSVAYNPLDKNYNGKWRALGVKVNRPQGAAKTKRGFYAK
jgi:VWFA-related protein